MNRCNKCHKLKCGCEDPLFTSQLPNCNSTQICPEYVYSGCVIYNGPDIPLFSIVAGMSLNHVLNNILQSIVGPGCILTVPTPACTSVTNIKLIKITSDSIDLSWNEITSATGYTVSYSTDNTTWTDLTAVSSATLHQKITGLDSDTDYYIKITTNCGSDSCESLTILVKTNP